MNENFESIESHSQSDHPLMSFFEPDLHHTGNNVAPTLWKWSDPPQKDVSEHLEQLIISFSSNSTSSQTPSSSTHMSSKPLKNKDSDHLISNPVIHGPKDENHVNTDHIFRCFRCNALKSIRDATSIECPKCKSLIMRKIRDDKILSYKCR